MGRHYAPEDEYEDDPNEPDESDMDDDDGPDESAETVECPHCGREVYEFAERCPKCGEYVTSEGEQKRTSHARWVVATAIAILVAMAYGYLKWGM
jgi:hypothetical protein